MQGIRPTLGAHREHQAALGAGDLFDPGNRLFRSAPVPADPPVITDMLMLTNGVQLVWSSVSGCRYYPQMSYPTATSYWFYTSPEIYGSGDDITYSAIVGPGAHMNTSSFYRVGMRP